MFVLALLPFFLEAADIGMIEKIKIELPGEKLEAVPVNERAPAILRIDRVEKTERGYRYEFDFVGLEPGDHNVMDYLQTVTGEKPKCDPYIVKVDRKLPETFRGEITVVPQRSRLPFAWYKLTSMILVMLWVICLPLLIFVGRKKVEEEVEPEPELPSLRERLQELLTEIRGKEGKEAWQRLEAMLIQYLIDTRKVTASKAYEQLLALKKDELAGPVIAEIERCLHAPGRGRDSLDRALDQCVKALEVKP